MGKKKQAIEDPYFEREKQKYGKPIPSREFILEYLKESGRPRSYKELYKALNLLSEEEREALRRRLIAMQRDGQLMQNRRGKYCLIDKLSLIAGHIESHPDGFGFVIPLDGSPDLFLSPKQMKGLLPGDQVLVREIPSHRPGRREAALVEVCERSVSHVVGRLNEINGALFIIPDNKSINQDVMIPPHATLNAVPGQIVVAEFLPALDMRAPLAAKVVEVLGEHHAPGMEIDIAIRSYELPYLWPQSVEKEAAQLPDAISEAELEGREDLRNLGFVTIDGEDAKDFDDAVYCVSKPRGGWTLYVAIADVSHYVKPYSGLDQQGYLRGNSVYFPGRVIPMLPEKLSNELCSLKPNVDRLCMVCELNISPAGEITKYRFFEAVMHSQARLTYTTVADILAGDKTAIQKNKKIVDDLKRLYDLYLALHAAREKRGAIDFDTVETRIVFDENKKIKEIVPVVRNEAHRLIEECMLVANVAAAQFLEKHKMPGLYRVHTRPNADKINDLRAFLSELGLHLYGGEEPSPADYAWLLKQVKDRPDAHLIQTVLLRSLSQAIYSPANEGHFGLAYEAYAHFTSPIRRYPDLILHRAIRHILKYKKAKGFAYDDVSMTQFSEHCSMTERRADEATRDVVDWLKCEYIMEHVGEEFDGIVTGVTAFGLFVQLKNVYVEGLVHVTALKNDYYHYDPLRHHLRGERTRTTYRLGDAIRVLIARVDLDERKIDFELA